jgi:RHS repeat-associated protein
MSKNQADVLRQDPSRLCGLITALLGPVALVVWALLGNPAHAQVCDSTRQCCPPLVPAGTAACESSVGNPVDLATGNKFQQERFVLNLGAGKTIEVAWAYNSLVALTGFDPSGLGPGWMLAWDSFLRFSSDKKTIQWVDGSGRVFDFVESQRNEWRAKTGFFGSLRTSEGTGVTSYTLNDLRNSRTMVFDHLGRLGLIEEQHKRVRLERGSAGKIEAVFISHPGAFERKVGFEYQAEVLTHLDLGQQKLVFSRSPQAVSIESVEILAVDKKRLYSKYKYEQARPGLLTELRSESNDTLDGLPSAWVYQPDGLVMRSTFSGGTYSQEHLEISYQADVLPTRKWVQVYGSKAVDYQFELVGSQWRLRQRVGPECFECRPTIDQWIYRPDGQIQEVKTHSLAGQWRYSLVYSYDALARPVGVVKRYAGKKAQGSSIVLASLRYRNTSWLPSEILQPSVVAGKMLNTKWRGVGAGSFEVLQNGWMIDELGQAKAIQRSWVQQTTAPQIAAAKPKNTFKDLAFYTQQHSVEYDDLNRPQAWFNDAGESVIRASWGREGAVDQHEVIGWATSRRQAERVLDDFGRLTAFRLPSGNWQYASYNSNGQIAKTTDAKGNVQLLTYSSDGKLNRLSRHAHGSDQPDEVLDFFYDQGRPIGNSVSNELGKVVNTWIYDLNGQYVEKQVQVSLKSQPPIRWAVHFQRDQTGRIIGLRIEVNGTQSTQVALGYSDEGRLETVRLNSLPTSWWVRLGMERLWAINTWSIKHSGPFAGQGAFPSREQPSGQPSEIAHEQGYPALVKTYVGQWRTKWDSGGRLAGIANNAQGKQQYLYDANSRRVAILTHRTDGTTLASYSVFDGHQVLTTVNSSGTLGDLVLYDGFFVAAVLKGGGHRQWFKSVSITAPPLLSGESFGANVVPPNPGGHYTGQTYDAFTGLVYQVGRFYNPLSGRFISPDPKGIGDAVVGQTQDALLDTHTFAGGRPDLFFDPDGAAKLMYYAVHNQGAKGSTVIQGFQQAKWAFHISDIAPSTDHSSVLGKKRNDYASTGTQALYDDNGAFVRSYAYLDSQVSSDKQAITWDTSSSDDPMAAFTKFYAGKVSSIEPFGIKKMDDDAATKMVWFLSTPPENRQACFAAAINWLPPIKFSAGEAQIHVTKSTEPAIDKVVGLQANKQRILSCKPPASIAPRFVDDQERMRVFKLEAAAELQESPPASAIYRDCSNNNSCRALTQIKVNGRSYYASYGRTQFVAETFLQTLIGLLPQLNDEEKVKLRLTEKPVGSGKTIEATLNDALLRARKTGAAYRDLRNTFGTALSLEQATRVWEAYEPTKKAEFTKNTGFAEAEFIDMLMYSPNGHAFTENEGLNAFATSATLRLPVGQTSFGDWYLWLFSTQDEYNFISMSFLRDNLREVLAHEKNAAKYAFAPTATPTNGPSNYDPMAEHLRRVEDDITSRVAKMHNAGGSAPPPFYKAKSGSGLANYMSQFLSTPGRGDWRSLRCSDELGPLQGLELQALNFAKGNAK